MTTAYIDASALVKLFKPERESEALLSALQEQQIQASSELIVVEVLCTAKRIADPTVLERADSALDNVSLVPFTESIRNRASATRFDPPLRTLDAIHLSTALSIEDDVATLVAYDEELCAAARAAGLHVESPA